MEPKKNNDTMPKPITRMENHNYIMTIFEGFARGEVLDVPCGEGALALRLRDKGFSVRCCDIDPALMKAKGFESKQADLNRERIDYPDSSFDYVVCVNGLHRLYNIQTAIAEFARMLKPKGRLVISIPNYSSIVRRMRFLLTGSIAKNIAKQKFKQIVENPEAHFRNPLGLPQLRATLIANGSFFFHLVMSPPTRLHLNLSAARAIPECNCFNCS